MVVLGLSFGTITRAADSPEAIFWNSVRKADVMEEYRLYTEQFPNGKFTREAWRRIGQLEAEAEAKRQFKDDIHQTKEAPSSLGLSTSKEPSGFVACTTDGQCSSGLYCINGRCKDQLQLGERCERSTECAGLQSQCLGGVCSGNGPSQSRPARVQPSSLTGCVSDGQCGSGLYCIQGKCNDQVELGGRCNRDTECAGLSTRCQLGKCV